MVVIFPFPRVEYPELAGFEEYFFEITERDLVLFAFNYVLHRNMLGHEYTLNDGRDWLAGLVNSAVYDTATRNDHRLETAWYNGIRLEIPYRTINKAQMISHSLDYDHVGNYGNWVDALAILFNRIYGDYQIFNCTEIKPTEIEIMSYQRLNDNAYSLQIEDSRDVSLIRLLVQEV